MPSQAALASFPRITSRQKSESGSSQRPRAHQARPCCRKNADPASVGHAIGPPARHPDRKWTGRRHDHAAEKASLAMRYTQPRASALARVRDGPIHGFELRGSASIICAATPFVISVKEPGRSGAMRSFCRIICQIMFEDPSLIESEFATPEEAEAHDHWFRAKVQESLDDHRPLRTRK